MLQKMIRKFVESNKYDNTIKKAIYNHNKYIMIQNKKWKR